jgi:hypothetical protein
MTEKIDLTLVTEIVERAQAIGDRAGVVTFRTEMALDIIATHRICPLDLKAMAEGDDMNLAHDVFGIARHFNRTTRQLEGGFTPRYALANQVIAGSDDE